MGLFQRITSTGTDKIAVHRFGSALRLWANGSITRAVVISAFNIAAGSETTELDALAASYAALPSGNAAQALAKAARLSHMEDVFLLCETQDLNETQAKNLLGF